MKRLILLFAGALVIALFTASCGSDDKDVKPTADFTYSIDGLKVTFTNLSKDVKSYEWEFGDENTSTEKDPVHTYATYGNKTVSLKAINGKESDIKSVTISLIRPLILIDGDFSDWDEVPAEKLAKSVQPQNAEYVSLKEFKACADENFIYLYIKGVKPIAQIAQVFIDIDNNPETGWTESYVWLPCGADLLIAGPFLDRFSWGDIFHFTSEDGGGWNWGTAIAEVTGIVEISEIIQFPGSDPDMVHAEISIARQLIPVTFANTVKIGFRLNDDGWVGTGHLPQQNSGDLAVPMMDLKMN